MPSARLAITVFFGQLRPLNHTVCLYFPHKLSFTLKSSKAFLFNVRCTGHKLQHTHCVHLIHTELEDGINYGTGIILAQLCSTV